MLSRLSPSEEEEAVAMGKHLREAMGGALKGYFQETLSFLETSEKNLHSFRRIQKCVRACVRRQVLANIDSTDHHQYQKA